MTALLQEMFDKVSRLPDDQQDAVAIFIQENVIRELDDGFVIWGPELYKKHGITDADLERTRMELGL